jgi:hypothetical protein
MAVFFFKIVSIAVKTLARPLILWVSYYNRLKVQESKNRYAIFLKNRLIWIGQTFNYYNIMLNRQIFRLTKDTGPIKLLSEEKALERGAEFVSELIVYSIILTVPIIEMLKSYKNNQIKEKKKKDYLIKIQNDVDSMIESHMNNSRNIKELRDRLKIVNNNIYQV